MKTKLVTILAILISMLSCDNVQSKLDKAVSEIEYAEEHKHEMNPEDWTNLEIMMGELENDFKSSRDEYSEEQIKEKGRIQGRYAALLVKKGINDFQESVQNLGNQVEGFVEGINSDTNNKTHENE